MKAPVPIVGGGIAGLTTALSLAHHGVASIVHEKAPVFEEVGAGIQLSPNAMSILLALGLGEALAYRTVTPAKIALHDGRTNKPLAEIPLGETAFERYGANYAVIHRADLQQVLADACDAHDLIDLKRGSTVEPDNTHPLIVAADGVHSAWRAVLRTSSHKRFTGYVAWRTTHPVEHIDRNPITKVWFGPKAHLVDYPISSGKARNLVAIAQTNDPQPNLSNPHDELVHAFAGWHVGLLARLAEQESWTPWPLFGVDPQDVWVDEHVALVGDAAHAMLPFMAQGGAMAIEDAWVLSYMLTSTPERDQALARYEMARKARVTRVWKEAARNGHIYHLTGAMAFARNAVLRAQSGSAMLARYDWLYGWKATGT